MLNDYKPTHDPNQDTFKVEYLVGASAVLGILFPYKYEIAEMLWAFSIWLESVAILPQLFMLQRTGEAETITTHYLFALGIYRALYIPNWLYRYFIETPSFFDPIAVVAGIIQTVLYSDFFYIYYTKYVSSIFLSSLWYANMSSPEYCRARSSTYQFEREQLFGRDQSAGMKRF
jgi:ER lumen protein retaining receptor